MTYGEKIAQLRKSNGMTQEDLGSVLNVSSMTVSKWEIGESLPNASTLSKIANFFQVPTSYFKLTYGEKIAQLRKANGMTQEDLGKVLNVTYQAVSKWERGESLPDFTTMSQMAKFFQVPLSYFEEDGEIAQPQAHEPAPVIYSNNNYVGTCTRCGRMIKEDDEYVSDPKLLCKNCAEIVEQQKQEQKAETERIKKARQNSEIREQLGGGFDVKLIISIIFAVACYVLFSVLAFTNTTGDEFLYGFLMLLVPLAAFAIVDPIAELFGIIKELFSKSYTLYDDDESGYKLNLSLIVGGAFAVVNIVLYLIMYLSFGNNFYFLFLLFGGAIISFTFISQYMWGSAVKDVFTCGGFTFKLPGIIFSLSVESILLMIVLKVVLGIVAILVFIATSILFAVAGIVGSVFVFIPCLIFKIVKDKKVVAENS